MSTMTPYESTARTLLNMQLVALYSQSKTQALSDTTKALQFVADLLAHDQRFSRLLQESSIAVEELAQYLEESLEELDQAKKREFVPMLVPVPPNLEQTLGYTGQLLAMFTSTLRNARYLGFYWSTGHVYWEDGLGGQTDSWSGYLTWYYHWIVSGSLGSYRDKLGSDDGDLATHEWLLDRKTRLVFIAPIASVRPLLHNQWPKEAFPNLNFEEATAHFYKARQHIQMPTSEEIMQLYTQEMEAVAELQRWLEQYWPMPVFGKDE